MNAAWAAADTHSDTARAAIDAFGAELLSHGLGAGVIFDACAADPGCALARVLAAALSLTRMTREGRDQAEPHLAAARALNPRCPRIILIVEAIAAWHAGDDARAASYLADVVLQWPQDLVSLKLCHILALGVGDVDIMRRTAAAAVAADPDAGFAAGMLAFALDQADEVDRAEGFARRAVDRNPASDPWAQHALAHVLAAREEWSHGRALLRVFAAGWERCSSFMRTHNWWHAALFSLALGHRDEALALFDQQIWGVRKDHCQDQVNAISLLARLELHGVNGSTRWVDIAAHVAPRIDDRVSPFLDLHYLYALARAGRDGEAERLAGALERDRSGPVALLAPAMLAHARGRHSEAALHFGRARPRLRGIGGSQMQRELFERLFVDSLLRAGRERRVYA